MTNKSMRHVSSGADRLAETLQEFGVDCVFGVPGSQNIRLFDSLERIGIRTILATSETSAGFMANGWFRASGRLGVFATISGPGFAFAVPALAEAALDSSAILMITGQPLSRGRAFDLQWLDQESIASALSCDLYTVETADAMVSSTSKALAAAFECSPKPVVLQTSKSALEQSEFRAPQHSSPESAAPTLLELPGDLVQSLHNCERPLILVGADAINFCNEVSSLAENIGAAVVTTPIARGLLPEDGERIIATDFLCDDINELSKLFEQSDLILGIGCRLSHNGTGGFSIRIPQDRFMHSYPDASILNANYSARWPIQATSKQMLSSLARLSATVRQRCDRGWTLGELADWRQRILRKTGDTVIEPNWPQLAITGWQPLIQEIRKALPDEAILVTDTGNHQIYTRKYYEVRAARGLIFPQDFQSMGFGIPAAIGAALAEPDRPTVVLIGDGAFNMSATELTTVVREKIPLIIILINDGWLSQIRHEQVVGGTSEKMSKLLLPNIKMFANSIGIRYLAGGRNLADQLRECLARKEPVLVELSAEDSPGFNKLKTISSAKRAVRNVVGSRNLKILKKILRH